MTVIIGNWNIICSLTTRSLSSSPLPSQKRCSESPFVSLETHFQGKSLRSLLIHRFIIRSCCQLFHVLVSVAAVISYYNPRGFNNPYLASYRPIPSQTTSTDGGRGGLRSPPRALGRTCLLACPASRSCPRCVAQAPPSVSKPAAPDEMRLLRVSLWFSLCC